MLFSFDSYVFNYILHFCNINIIKQLNLVSKKSNKLIHNYCNKYELYCIICGGICKYYNGESCCQKCFPLYKLNFPLAKCINCVEYTTYFFHQIVDNIIENICTNCCFKFYFRRELPKNYIILNSFYDNIHKIYTTKNSKNFIMFSLDTIKCLSLVFQLGYLDINENFYQQLNSILIIDNDFLL